MLGTGGSLAHTHKSRSVVIGRLSVRRLSFQKATEYFTTSVAAVKSACLSFGARRVHETDPEYPRTAASCLSKYSAGLIVRSRIPRSHVKQPATASFVFFIADSQVG